MPGTAEAKKHSINTNCLSTYRSILGPSSNVSGAWAELCRHSVAAIHVCRQAANTPGLGTSFGVVM